MPEKTKTKKLRIYKFASEYNLATDSLVDFLRDKGYEVKSHMTALTDEMTADIFEHFKKDIEKAEKHYRKISEFQKKRIEKSEEEVAEENEEAEDKPDEEIVIIEKESEEAVETEEKEVETVVDEDETEKETEETPVETAAEEPLEEETVKEAVEKSVEKEVEEPVDEAQEEVVETFKTQSELDLQKKKTGLTIVGKVELAKRKKKKTAKKEDEVPDIDILEQEKKPAEREVSDSKKKKKKKVLKSKNKSKTDEKGDDKLKTKKKKKTKRLEVDKREVDAAIKRTMLSIDESSVGDRASFRKKKKKEKQEINEKILEQQEIENLIIKVTEFIQVNELANLMGVSVSDVISKCIGLGLMVSINQRLDFETITLVADEFGVEVELQEEYTSDILEDKDDPEDTLVSRSPVVTIMGHVDHGKSSLLDYIREANVVAGESGGITQHIGAYKVKIGEDKFVTFLDTPGHEAFTAMRARGASVTDIVVLVVAADDAVMPQTVEAINHAQAAGVPIIIAINKVDKPNSNTEKIRQQLSERNVLVEDWGGKYQSVELSAKTGQNVDLLLEKILLEAEILELKANPNRHARGTVVESQLEQGRGITATILIQKGTLKIGQPFVAGNFHGRVRAMFDERNNKLKEVGPSTPVLVLGFEDAPQAGDVFVVVDTEREARETANKRQQLKREQDHRQVHHLTLDEIAQQISQGGYKELPIIVKGDVDGSVEALSDSLMKLSTQSVAINVILKGVGGISESDVILAAASRAIIVGFHVRPNVNARKLAESEKVDFMTRSMKLDLRLKVCLNRLYPKNWLQLWK